MLKKIQKPKCNKKKDAKRTNFQNKRCQEGKNVGIIKKAKLTSKISYDYDAVFWN